MPLETGTLRTTFAWPMTRATTHLILPEGKIPTDHAKENAGGVQNKFRLLLRKSRLQVRNSEATSVLVGGCVDVIFCVELP